MECFKNIIHYESTIIISLPCIQIAKPKSCSVWCFSEKNKKQNSGDMGGMGHGASGPPPVGDPAPTYPLTRTKMTKISHFWLFIFFPLNPSPSHLTPTKNNLVHSLEKAYFQSSFKACENIQWCKNTCYLEVGFKACKIFTWVKYCKLLDKNTNIIGLQSSLTRTLQ